MAVTTGEPKTATGTADSAWPTYQDGNKPTGKARVVVLGSGWAAASFIKALKKEDKEKFDVVVVSPRNYFLYTPLLPAVATGTCEERSIVEPIRRILDGKGAYYEAECQDIIPEERTVVACFPKDAGFPAACFKVPYDYLVVAVGSVNNTFGIQGVKEHAMFFKSIDDANRLRGQVSECFERASLPQTTVEERERLLSFVVVGGGPTGVEVAAELYDMVHEDLRKLYPDLIQHVKIRVIELQSHLLSTYDRAISNYTKRIFDRNGILAVLNARVAAVERFSVRVVDAATNVETDVPFGACVWATGVAMNPLVKQLQQKLPEQANFRSLQTDGQLRVLGSDGTIFALGDAATITQPRALDYADELFAKYDVNGDSELQLDELRALLTDASAQFPHLAEHATFLESKYGTRRFGGLVANAFSRNAATNGAVFESLSEDMTLTREEFRTLLTTIDSGLRALPATAQVAKQQGDFLAAQFRSCSQQLVATQPLPEKAAGFKYSHKGSLAYVGSDRAVMDVPNVGPITGTAAGLLWKGFETWSQISWRNQFLVALDWGRTKVFGRDISRV